MAGVPAWPSGWRDGYVPQPSSHGGGGGGATLRGGSQKWNTERKRPSSVLVRSEPILRGGVTGASTLGITGRQQKARADERGVDVAVLAVGMPGHGVENG